MLVHGGCVTGVEDAMLAYVACIADGCGATFGCCCGGRRAAACFRMLHSVWIRWFCAVIFAL